MKKNNDDKEKAVPAGHVCRQVDRQVDEVVASAEGFSEPKEEVASNATEVVDESKGRIEELENQVRRALADYQNLEKRVMEERRVWVQQANKGMLLRFLPGVDTLELAAKHSKDQGIGLALAQILQALREEGIKKIATEGLVFDPHTMECVETVDGQEGIVEKEIRAGYTLYDKILRPAQVTVGNTKS